ncbi:Nuclear speckle splicing regulatory protein 1 [Phytophthora boehmeriae]|uniref:Nuclear speckle splicing regulatory protein 1 n=1 Tax=Phytophthora boehmeriae TaxID=109152 RepID=A0A8T1VUW4_9STRA|nr:Nuclear speckle splicing regulatory protein 1 [Phytophthora boehmeriae]
MSFSMKLPAGKTKKKPLGMPSTSGTKQYGLIIPKKDSKKKELPSAFNVFADAAAKSTAKDSKDTSQNDEASARRRVGAEAARSLQQSQVERMRAQALADDPSVFDYDAVYDDMKSARESEATKKAAKREAEKKKPKYISTLLQQAKIREVENERIRERRLLNERKADDEQFRDKEKLVSASYKRKLQEMQRWDAEDARLAALEDREDVTKQGEDAMAGFYANLNKNIAMGGSTANARSAYTAKETQQDTKASEAATIVEKEHAEPSPKKHRSNETRSEVQSPAARATVPDQKESTSNADDSALRVPEPQKQEEPKPSKEDAIAAARARFLARKAQRKTSS